MWLDAASRLGQVVSTKWPAYFIKSASLKHPGVYFTFRSILSRQKFSLDYFPRQIEFSHMSIEPLPQKFYKLGFRYDVARAEFFSRKAFVLYKKTSWDKREVYWEFRILRLVDGVSKRRSRRGPPWYFSHWSQPPADSWGFSAWTFRTLSEAEEQMRLMLEFHVAGGITKYMNDLRRHLVGRVYKPRNPSPKE